MSEPDRNEIARVTEEVIAEAFARSFGIEVDGVDEMPAALRLMACTGQVVLRMTPAQAMALARRIEMNAQRAEPPPAPPSVGR